MVGRVFVSVDKRKMLVAYKRDNDIDVAESGVQTAKWVQANDW